MIDAFILDNQSGIGIDLICTVRTEQQTSEQSRVSVRSDGPWRSQRSGKTERREPRKSTVLFVCFVSNSNVAMACTLIAMALNNLIAMASNLIESNLA